MDVLRLLFRPVIFPNPRVERVFIDPEIASRLRNWLFRFDREFHGALFELSRISFHRWFTHRTHLSRSKHGHDILYAGGELRRLIRSAPPQRAVTAGWGRRWSAMLGPGSINDQGILGCQREQRALR